MATDRASVAQDAGLVRRGLWLLALVLLIVGFVWLAWWRRPSQPLPVAQSRPELLAPLLCVPAAGFPGGVSWGAVYLLGDALPSAPGWEVRYNAAAALARRGSAKVPWSTVAEMLDEHRQLCNFRVYLENGKVVADEAAARRVLLSGLDALSQWHKKGAGQSSTAKDLATVRAALERLTHSPILEIRTQAEKTLSLVFPAS